MYSYERPLKKSEVFVGLLNDTKFTQYNNLDHLISKVSEKYSFTFKSFDSLEQCLNYSNLKDYVLAHSIVLTEINDLNDAANRYFPLLEHYRTMSLGPVYLSEETFNEAGKKVEELKKKFHGKINFLRPNSTSQEGIIFTSVQKIVDNSICDTVRIKFIPKKINKDISSLVNKFAPFFRESSRVYKELKLFHRAPSDGFFAIRVPEGFLITSTKTDKTNLDLNRISLVYGYNQITNTIEYSGSYLPSSDVVEASIVFANSNVDSLIHTHASDRFTRNLDFIHKIAVPQMSYGESDLGFVLAKVIHKYLDDFLIMEDHGELFAFTKSSNLELPALKVRQICEESLSKIT